MITWSKNNLENWNIHVVPSFGISHWDESWLIFWTFKHEIMQPFNIFGILYLYSHTTSHIQNWKVAWLSRCKVPNVNSYIFFLFPKILVAPSLGSHQYFWQQKILVAPSLGRKYIKINVVLFSVFCIASLHI